MRFSNLRYITFSVAALVSLLVLSTAVLAQVPPPPPPPPPPPIPIDTAVIMLMAGLAAVGAKKAYDKSKHKGDH